MPCCHPQTSLAPLCRPNIPGYIPSPFSRSMRSFTTKKHSRDESTPLCGQQRSTGTFSLSSPRSATGNRLVSMLLTHLTVVSAWPCLFMARRIAPTEVQLNTPSMSINSPATMQTSLCSAVSGNRPAQYPSCSSWRRCGKSGPSRLCLCISLSIVFSRNNVGLIGQNAPAWSSSLRPCLGITTTLVVLYIRRIYPSTTHALRSSVKGPSITLSPCCSNTGKMLSTLGGSTPATAHSTLFVVTISPLALGLSPPICTYNVAIPSTLRLLCNLKNVFLAIPLVLPARNR